MLTLLGKCQNCCKHNVNYVINKCHEGQTIRISLATHFSVPSHTCDYKVCHVPKEFNHEDMFTHWYVLVQGDGFQYKRKEMFRPTSPHVVLLAGQILKDSNFKNTL